ncbi:MAG TPA: 16S rRNA (uracil(1498)-N(3))-methyltransferase [Steroidobacteraceae bacterium]|jgi:16S rRNA (uracil1498-N3)-methyltransferase|nr:16S rRNA (uracil(1498)-N(3))-methyltransferase [Steroidobacteraceae bacterium]
MRLTRCFIDQPLSAQSVITLPEAAAVHIRRVLRLRAGAELTVFDGRGGEYAARLLAGGEPLRAQVGEHHPVEREAPLPVTLLQGLARGERMDWIVQKATELGAAAISPVAGRHSVVQLEQSAAARRVAHWRSVAIAACEQCGRNRLPLIHPLRELPGACAEVDSTLRLLLVPEARTPLVQHLEQLRDMHAELGSTAFSIALLVGPEGGLADEEIELACRAGFSPCTLGPRTLRTETAPLAALAAIQTLAGDFRAAIGLR